MSVTIDPHASLDAGLFITELPSALETLCAPPELLAMLSLEASAPLTSSDEVRLKIRDLLRVGGFKPTGRAKPASEYLLGAAQESRLEPINPVVDACNVASLHSGLPISVVDLDRVQRLAEGGGLRIGVAEKGLSYVFNASGQTMDLGGLLCLFDAEGPCANAVKDSQRTKTWSGTRVTLSVVWGSRALSGRTAATVSWYRQLLASVGATTRLVE